MESTLADLLRKHLLHDFLGLVEVFESSDRLSIPAGAKWLSEVTEHLKTSDLHLILCSREAMLRPWIQFEAGAAHLRGIPVIPLCHSGLTCAQLPVPLSEYEGVPLSEPAGFKALFQSIAGALGSALPDVDYDAYAREVSVFEAEYSRQHALASSAQPCQGGIEEVPDPKALCISSPQFAQLGFENQLEVVLKAFPAVMPHQKVFSSGQLRQAIAADQKFDVAHIAAYVCPRTGALYFSEVDLVSGEGISPERDVLSAEALASLLELAGVRLVVIGSCDSIVLGIKLISTCHVVVAQDMVSPKMMAAWVDAFYSKLSGSSLMEALDYALKISQAPMRFYARQIPGRNIVFRQKPQPVAA